MTTTGKNRIIIYGPKNDGTYVVEFRTAAGEALAISIPGGEARVIRYFQERMPYGLWKSCQQPCEGSRRPRPEFPPFQNSLGGRTRGAAETPRYFGKFAFTKRCCIRQYAGAVSSCIRAPSCSRPDAKAQGGIAVIQTQAV